MQIVYDYLNAIHLFLTEPIVVELKFNNGVGAGWRITIAFNTTHDHDNQDGSINENERIGVVPGLAGQGRSGTYHHGLRRCPGAW